MPNDCKVMAMGKLANPDVIFKRKFRWGLTVKPYCAAAGTVEEDLVGDGVARRARAGRATAPVVPRA